LSGVFEKWKHLPTLLRHSIIRAAQQNNRFYRWLLFRHIDAKDRANGTQPGLPPAELRYLVSSSPDAESFVRIGEVCAADIQSALLKVGHDLRSFTRILDFGCGCGRTLMHLKDLAPSAQIYGADIDVKAIEWSKQNLKFAKFEITKPVPPTEYADETFDFIYAISVFTHLNEDFQFRWLEELRRIAQPGAILLLTVDSSLVGEQDFVIENTYEKGLFPAWYQNAYHSREYVLANFCSYFEVLDYFQRSMNGHQDVVMLRKRGGTNENETV
jgi:SAM-dependent methyltransferase